MTNNYHNDYIRLLKQIRSTNNYCNDVYIKSLLKQIKSKLNDNEEVKLECVSIDDFLGLYKGDCRNLDYDILNSSLIVEDVVDLFQIVKIKDCKRAIKFEHLKYFKIKEDYLDNFVEQIESNLFNDGEVRLECIDEYGFLDETLLKNVLSTSDFLNSSLTVKSMNKQLKILQFKDTHQTLSFDHLKYFRLKPKLDKVDVQNRLLKELLTAINKNKSINIIYMDDDIIKFKYNRHSIIEYNINDLLYEDKLLEALRRIELLYKPFVIASESDLYNIKDGSYGLLTNGSRFEVESSIGGHYDKVKVIFLLDYDSKENVKIDFDKLTEVHELDYNVLRGSKIYPIKPSKNDSFWD